VDEEACRKAMKIASEGKICVGRAFCCVTISSVFVSACFCCCFFGTGLLENCWELCGIVQVCRELVLSM